MEQLTSMACGASFPGGNGDHHPAASEVMPDDFPRFLSLPTDRPRSDLSDCVGLESRTLPSDVAQALARLPGFDEDRLPTLLAAFAVLLQRYSGDSRMLVGVPLGVAERSRSGSLAESTAIAEPLRIDLSGDPPFQDFEARLRRQWRDTGTRRSSAFGTSLPGNCCEDIHGNTSQFQVLFSFSSDHSIDSKSPHGPQSGDRPRDPPPGTELHLRVIECEEGIGCALEFDTALYDDETIRRMLGHYEVLLRGIVANPVQRISTLPLLTPAERRQLIEEWNLPQAAAPATSRKFLHEAIAAQAAKSPDAIAIVFEDRKLTFREVDEQSNRLAHFLVRRGVGPDVFVGICLPRSPELVLGLLAILKAGGVIVPLEPSYPDAQLSELLSETRPAVLITDSHQSTRFRSHGVASLFLDAEREAIAAESSSAPAVSLTGENLAIVMFSSGSTGKPKAIPRAHSTLGPSSWARSTFQLGESDRHLLKTSLDSTLLIREVFWPLQTGGRMVIAGQLENHDTASLVRLLIDHEITIVTLVPSLLRLLIAAEGLEACTALRHVTCFGEPLPADVEERFCQRLPAALSIFYGTTEAPSLAFRQCRRTGPAPMGNLGWPLGRSQIYVLDSLLQPVPIGVPGELVAGGPGLAVGYLNRREQTEEHFIRHPFSQDAGARLYRTGDRARWRPDGSLEFMGRLDDQIKIRGYRVEPAEVEAVLAQHPDVREAAVVARPNHAGENQLVAFLVATRHDLTVRELRAHLVQRLPVQMIPSIYVGLAQLPRRPNGKLDRKALPTHEHNRFPSGQLLVAPRNFTEELLASIWCEVLGVDHVSPLDNFFDLGGHSILAARLLSRITAAFHQTLPLRALFLAPTMRQIAELLRQNAPSTAWPALIPIQPDGLKPPLFCVAAPNVNALGFVFLARHLRPDQPVYGLQRHDPGNPEKFYVAAEYESLAAASIDELTSVWPEGPCLLCGFCEGAHIAFEMARQLSAAGREVALLAMFDTWPLENTASRVRLRMSVALGRWKRRWQHGRLTNVPNYVRRQIDRLTGSLRPAGRSSAPNSPNAATAMPADLSQLGAWQRWEKRMWPGKDFVPPVFDGRITVFRVCPQPFWRVRDDSLGWRSRAAQGVEIHDIPGNHATFLREPHVKALAEKLAECAARVRR